MNTELDKNTNSTVQCRILVYGGQFVNEYMLSKGIYTTDEPRLHWDEDITVEKYISDHKKILDSMVTDYPAKMYENIRKCKFVLVELRILNNSK